MTKGQRNMTDYKLVPVDLLKDWHERINTIATEMAFNVADEMESILDAAPAAQGEPVAWVHEKIFDKAIGRADRFEGTTKRPEGMYAAGQVALFKRPPAPQPAEQQPAPDSIEAAAKRLAELFSYPWEYMPEQGKQSMRDNVKAVLIAAYRKGGEK